jgi:hypothetical protein
MMMHSTRQSNRHGTRPPWILPLLASLALLAAPPAATAWERGKVDTFATLPAGEAHPKGSPWTAPATCT